MLRIGKNNPELKIVGDQIGTPTYAGDIANAIIHLLKNHREERGILNMSGKDICSWADFAKLIFQVASQVNPQYPVPKVTEILTKEYPTAARRPLYSVLSKTKNLETITNFFMLKNNIFKALDS